MSKKITHEQARLLLREDMSSLGVYTLRTYITQQEKQEKLLELYKKLNNLYEKLYTMELSELSLNSNYYEIEIIKLKQQIKELENE